MNHIPRKRFGQNFLHDPGVIRNIIAAINPQPGQDLIEIGPGQGAITLPLLGVCGHLQAVELDRDLLEPLRQTASTAGKLTLHNRDALRTDFCALRRGEQRLRVIGNLPYNISTPLLFHLLDQADCIEDMHFMLQKEVVERMAAHPGSSAYGRLSVMLQYRCEVIPLFGIGPGAFRPPPKVESAFVRLLPYRTPPTQVIDETLFAQIVRLAFGQRRKTLRNTLKGVLDSEDFTALGVDPQIRAEQLDLKTFARLANHAAEKTANRT
ncbi:MAG: 16S rRNA (adenine(1518)-N(6)/adenine(1519)-N(6))-dimethyltransferase RsmA [Gammaproteobacteria bacterium]|nr:16S rRNA (adenine(1518)-N(6)/adenine(1519)-N(6))-dimethyltransferase RsmA [Gammaproteobacteria bacterium]MBU2477747.1 16S rRNA (adenine(1518)-N(6)/adenine(1519)-N(6))-dimethyltransferase RsmA [Gammaproteobacteria bacterium]